MPHKYVVQYLGEDEEWIAIPLSNGEFAVSTDKNKSLEQVKSFVSDLKEYLGK